LMAGVWSLVAGGTAFFVRRDYRSGLAIGLVVLSHWVLDAITWPMTAVNPAYSSGMPIFFSLTPAMGLGLYRSTVGVFIGEAGITLTGVAIYVLAVIRAKKEKESINDRGNLSRNGIRGGGSPRSPSDS
jgi:hypothetical protein